MAGGPTKEIASSNPSSTPTSAFTDLSELVPELAWPSSIAVYDKMRTDEQIAALLLSFTLPIFGYEWFIKPNGARDEVVEHVANDFGLPIAGQDPQPLGRSRNRFSYRDYLYHSLLKLSYGSMFFEQIYRYGDDGKFHIRKLAPRMPASISEIKVDNDSGLLYIKQFPTGQPSGVRRRGNGENSLIAGGMWAPEIPIERLIAHVNEKEGGNWVGRPWLCSLYRSWLIKDRLLRVDAIKHERDGMGVPIGEAPPGASQKVINFVAAMAAKLKVGEDAGGALPNGAKITLEGVRGSLPDTLASIRYHDEQMARRFCAPWMQLGSTQTGSRALGETFVDFFGLAQESVAQGIADVTNAHAIEDLVDINYSVDEAAPLVSFKSDSDSALPTDGLVALIDSGAITVDEGLESYIRSAHNLPKLTGPRPTDEPVALARPQTRERIRVLNAAEKREPTEVEQQAEVDFDGMKKTFQTSLTSLVDTWKTTVKASQITELVALAAITEPDDLIALADLQATANGADQLSEATIALALVLPKPP